jgi:hypothetical protein
MAAIKSLPSAASGAYLDQPRFDLGLLLVTLTRG